MSFLKKLLSFKVLAVLSFPVALLISGGMVLQGSTAAFSGVTNGGPEAWDAGKVTLTNNHASALFAAGTITPGYSETHCITITSTANVASTLKMYTSAVSSTGTPTLSSFLNVQVVEGSGGTNTDGANGGCAGFVPDSGQNTNPTFSGTLASFANNNSYSTGVGNRSLAAGGSQQYKITVSLPSSAPNSLQGTTAGATFVWETQG